MSRVPTSMRKVRLLIDEPGRIAVGERAAPRDDSILFFRDEQIGVSE